MRGLTHSGDVQRRRATIGVVDETRSSKDKSMSARGPHICPNCGERVTMFAAAAEVVEAPEYAEGASSSRASETATARST